MSIYRGAGGAGDAVNDASSEAILVQQLVVEAQADADAAAASATAAAASATAAAASASTASTAATNAQTAETNAETAETNAELAETNAETAQAAAEAAQAAAETAQTAAELAETNAETAETNAETAASSATSSASSASTSATNAASSASAASTSATNASNSATAASTSASNASTSETNAASSASSASTSASNAATSETNAAASASSASTSATTATTQAGIATTQAGLASTSASNAATSETNASVSSSAAATSATNASNSASAAATSETNAAASFDSFDDRYLGAKSSAPTLDNDGNTLLVGALYFNSVDSAMKVWNGTAWLDAYASLSGALIATNNLADLTNTTTARSNLGVAIGTNVQAWDADLDTWATKTAPSGTVVGTSDSQTLTNKTLTSPVVTGGSIDNTPIGATTASTGAFSTLSATGVTTVQAGTVSAPAITTTGDTNTGIFFPAADTIAFAEGGVESMRITSAGNVGIGTSSPADTEGYGRFVDLNGSGGGAYYARTNGSATNYTLFGNFGADGYVNNRGAGVLYFSNNGSERMRITSAGLVGIGTSSPSQRLSVNGNIQVTDGATNFQMGVDNFATGYGMGTTSNTPLIFAANGSERMRINASGQVGIGTSPTQVLDVSSSDSRFNLTSTGSGQTVGISIKGGAGGGDLFNFIESLASAGTQQWYVGGGGTANTLTFRTNGANERMRIDSSGNVGIGTSSYSDRFIVMGGARANTGIISSIQAGASSNAASKLHFSDTWSWNWTIGGVSSGDFVFTSGEYGTIVGTERMRIDSIGRVGIGTSSPVDRLTVAVNDNSALPSCTLLNTNAGSSASCRLVLGVDNDVAAGLIYGSSTNSTFGANALAIYQNRAAPVTIWTNNTERMRITSDGYVYIGRTSDTDAAGITLGNDGFIRANRDGQAVMVINRNTNDGDLVSFRQAGTTEGTISVSGTTVSYNGGHLSRWSQLPDDSKDNTILKGTVMSNLDDMCVWEKDGVVADNEQLNKMQVSSVEGDTNVAGVFVNWTMDDAYGVDDMNVAMTGDMIIRIADGVVVQKGDLLMSAGDGTAMPQGDDIVRSKTIAKVTSNYVTCTYADGSYCVPCVLMAC